MTKQQKWCSGGGGEGAGGAWKSSLSSLSVLKSPLSSQTSTNASVPMPALEPHKLPRRAEEERVELQYS